MSIFS